MTNIALNITYKRDVDDGAAKKNAEELITKLNHRYHVASGGLRTRSDAIFSFFRSRIGVLSGRAQASIIICNRRYFRLKELDPMWDSLAIAVIRGTTVKNKSVATPKPKKTRAKRT